MVSAKCQTFNLQISQESQHFKAPTGYGQTLMFLRAHISYIRTHTPSLLSVAKSTAFISHSCKNVFN